ESFGNNSFVIHAAPAAMRSGEEQKIIEELLEQMKHEADKAQANFAEKIITTLAKKFAHYTHTLHQPEAQQALIDELFACTQPEYTPSGKKIFTLLRKEDLEDILG